MANNWLVLDLETKRSAQEVGGWGNCKEMGVSIVGVYDYQSKRYSTHTENRWGGYSDLQGLLTDSLVIGFNLDAFDMPVLSAELGDWVLDLPTLDLLKLVQQSLGHRLSLDALAVATLGRSKTGSGLEALELYRQKEWDKLKEYCLEDVKITKDLFEHAHSWAQLAYYPRRSRKVRYFDVDVTEALVAASDSIPF